VTTLLFAVWTASLFGSAHCVGMCGPLAILAGTHGQQSGLKAQWHQVAGYHFGRLVAYSLLGAAFGWVGQLVDIGGSFVGVTRFTAYAAGSLMVVMGVVSLLRQLGVHIAVPNVAQPLSRAISRGFRLVSRLDPGWKALAIGGLTSLMPCGWLYVFLVTAAGVADPFWSAVTMTVFWAGTVPLLLVVLLGVNTAMQRLPIPLTAITAVLAILIGLLTLTGRAQVVLDRQLPVTHNIQDLKSRIEQAPDEELPCCSQSKSVEVRKMDQPE
jgi:uncharacterized protein